LLRFLFHPLSSLKILSGCSSLFLLLICSLQQAHATTDTVQVSGFGQLVAGYLDDANGKYQNYGNSLSIDSQSLVGLQLDWQITPKLSFTSQLLGHSNNERQSGVEWLYLTYEFNSHWQMRLGKQRTPFFTYSNVQDVGFAYSWISPPQQLYNGLLFPSYDGANLQYRTSLGSVFISVEAYWGEYEGDYNIADTALTLDVQDLHGIILQSQWHNLSMRLAFHTASVTIPEPVIDNFSTLLDEYGFVESADSIRLNGDVDVFFAGLSYHDLNYFIETEFMHLEGNSGVFPKTNSAYLTAGIYLSSFVFHATIAKSKVDYKSMSREIPIGESAELDNLARQYETIYNEFPNDSLDSYSIGTRYNLNTFVAFKGEITWLKGKNKERAFFQPLNENFDNEAILYQIAIEWAF
jgi:hypothetical protein